MGSCPPWQVETTKTMRTATVSLLAGACLMQAAGAFAADLDYGVLRGSDYEPAPPPAIDWSGVYAGGHGGWSSTAHGFGSGLQPIVAGVLYQTTIESEMQASHLLRPEARRTTGSSFGGFAGYNFVSDDFVFGIEGDYTSLNQSATSSDGIGRTYTTKDGYFNYVDLAGTSRTKLMDYGTLRGRVGYMMGSLLPFVTAGVAFGRARITDSATVAWAGYDAVTAKANAGSSGGSQYVNAFGYNAFDPANPGKGQSPGTTVTRTAQKYAAGFAAGFGLDFALTSNIFLRGEYQYILFDDLGSHKANVNTVRAAAAVKF
jgi:outer membrane immunogenic protein